MPLVSPSIYRLQEWVGVEASDRAQDRGIHPEEERAANRSVGTDEQDGLAGMDQEAENDDVHRAPVGAEADPRGPNQVLTGHFRERSGLGNRGTPRCAQSPLPSRGHKLTKMPFSDP